MAVDLLDFEPDPIAPDYCRGTPDYLRYGGLKLFPNLFFIVEPLPNLPLSIDFLKESDFSESSATLIFPAVFEILIKFSKFVFLSSPSKQISSRRSLTTPSDKPFCIPIHLKTILASSNLF